MLHGYEELSTARGGYIYWRGIAVEHFNRPFEQIDDARRLAGVCRHLEAIGVPVDSNTAVWFGDWFKAMEPGDPWAMALYYLIGSWYSRKDGVLFEVCAKETKPVIHLNCGTWVWVERADYLARASEGWQPLDLYQGEKFGVLYTSAAACIEFLKARGITPEQVTAQFA